MNEDFIICEQKKKIYSLKKMREDKKIIKRENEQMIQRMTNLQSFISARDLDKSFNEEHEKMMKKMRKVENGKLHLPKIPTNKTQSNRNYTEPNVNV